MTSREELAERLERAAAGVERPLRQPGVEHSCRVDDLTPFDCLGATCDKCRPSAARTLREVARTLLEDGCKPKRAWAEIASRARPTGGCATFGEWLGKWYVPLPLFEDGEPVRVGDELERFGEALKVESVKAGGDAGFELHHDYGFACFAAGERVRRPKPPRPKDTLERVEADERTCRMEMTDTGNEAAYEHREHIARCLSCGHEFGYVQFDEAGDTWQDELPRHCPSCGAKVVGE